MSDTTRILTYRNGRLAEDPRGLDAVWKIGDRHYIARIEDVYVRETPSATMLRTRFFNGEQGPDVCAGSVRVLIRTWEAPE